MNKWIGMGRLTDEPDFKAGECNVARFRLAVDRRVKKENQQNADFISCVAFGKQADFVNGYLHKGTKIVVEGRIQTGSYTNKEGAKVYTTDIVTESIEFAESKKTDGTAQTPSTDDFLNVPEGLVEELPFS